jgi:hypothetical protein
MSFCCVPKRVLDEIGTEPFKLRVAEDVYFTNLLPFCGGVVYLPKPLAAYRIREGSLASNRLKLTEGEVRSFELLEDRYNKSTNAPLVRAYERSFATKRRLYAKVLLGAGKLSEARDQLWRSLMNCGAPVSLARSLGLLALSYLPRPLQPAWPPSHRVWNSAEEAAAPTVRTSGEKG